MKFILHHRRARSFQDALVNLVHRREGETEEFWALRGVSFDVHPGETLGIIGQNGSGKSTILKLMTRILDPTSGSLTVNGRVSALIELGAGFHPDLSGRENIYLNGSILGFSRADMDRRFDAIVSFAELERFIDTPVKHYSSGMYMRLGFAVAINVDPDILIIDEVLAVGDEAFQRKCLDRISEFHRHGKAIIFVSHGIDVVTRLCDRVVWLDQGTIQAIGRAAHVGRLYSSELKRRDVEKKESARDQADRDAEAGKSASADSVLLGIEVLECEVFAPDDSLTTSFRTGDGLRLRLRARVVDSSYSPSIGFSILRSDGLLVHRSIPHSVSKKVFNASSDFAAEVVVDSLPLLAGDYSIVPYIVDQNRESAPISVTEFARTFSVWSDREDQGLVSLVYDWLDRTDVSQSPTTAASTR
jgi:ABC-type polysaccharide/polyol phosphate transport system ATPase subunit